MELDEKALESSRVAHVNYYGVPILSPNDAHAIVERYLAACEPGPVPTPGGDLHVALWDAINDFAQNWVSPTSINVGRQKAVVAVERALRDYIGAARPQAQRFEVTDEEVRALADPSGKVGRHELKLATRLLNVAIAKRPQAQPAQAVDIALATRLYNQRHQQGDTTMKIEQIARIAHEVNRAYCASLGDTSQPAWEDAPEWQRKSAMDGVTAHLASELTPEQSHELWLDGKRADGWKYGPVKDPEKKEHPCFVPYGELPAEQRAKDYLFRGVVAACKSA